MGLEVTISRPIRRGRLAWPVLALAAALLLAAAAVPPMLDWSRFRSAIAAIASARLGRPVIIGGAITLRLLPQAVLTASDVTMPDQGNGISVQVAALRLQVATLPLLEGHLRLRDLVLSAPILRLPVSLPEPIAHPTRPQIPHMFAARIEDGTLRIGEAEITGINANIHGGPALVSAAPTELSPPNGAFGAEGFATVAGRPWRFTCALGAPDADGVSAIDLSIHGQGQAGSTSATLRATLADGLVQGRVRAGGPDLSLLLPTSHAPWQADAPFEAGADRVEARDIALSLGGAVADGALTLQLTAPARLDGHLHAGDLDLDGWPARLAGSLAYLASSPRLHVQLEADRTRLLGGTLQDLHATLVSDGNQLGLEDARAMLPGGAHLTLAHARLAAVGPHAAPTLIGAAGLDAPDLRATLDWLRPLLPREIGALPAGAASQAALTFQATLGPSGLRADHIAGRLDRSLVTGSVAAHPGGRPALEAELAFDTLDLDAWTAGLTKPGGLPALAAQLSAAETHLRLSASKARWGSIPVASLSLDARTGAAGLQLAGLHAGIGGADAAASGTMRPDGTLLGAAASLSIPDLARLAPLAPLVSRAVPGLWHGPAHLALAAEGPPGALALQLRTDIGDLVAEAEATRDTVAGSGTATLTVRHPGAPRLLADLGVPAASLWLDRGSLTLRTHLRLRPGHITAEDFDLDAAALRLGGHLEADTGKHLLTGAIDAEQLALPAEPPAAWAAALAGWQMHVKIAARALLLGLRPAATDLSADLEASASRLAAPNIAAHVAGGRALLSLALDAPTQTTALRGVFIGAGFTGPFALPPLDTGHGVFDLGLDVTQTSGRLASLAGQAHAAVHGVRLGVCATPRAASSVLDLSGRLDASIAQGRLTLVPAHLGELTLSGTADFGRGTTNLAIALAGVRHAHLAGDCVAMQGGRR